MAVKFLRLRPEAKRSDIIRVHNDMVLKLEAVIVGLEKENKRLADEVKEQLATEIQKVRQEIEGLDMVTVNEEIEALKERVSSLEGYHNGGSIFG